jgi:hypothetical protein
MDQALLNYVSDVCRTRRIPFISASTLEAWKAAADSIGRIKGSDEARRAAVLLSTVIDHDAGAVRTAFGQEVATLVGQLAPSALLDLNGRAAHWARAASQGGVAAQAAIALLAAECSTAIEERDKEILKRYLDILVATNGAPAAIRDEARLMSGRLSLAASPSASTAPRQIALISMSIDMAGSTEAKTRMRELAADDDRRHEFYRYLYREFLRHSRFVFSIASGTSPARTFPRAAPVAPIRQ